MIFLFNCRCFFGSNSSFPGGFCSFVSISLAFAFPFQTEFCDLLRSKRLASVYLILVVAILSYLFLGEPTAPPQKKTNNNVKNNGGGFKYLYFQPDPWGNVKKSDSLFSDGWETSHGIIKTPQFFLTRQKPETLNKKAVEF